MKAETQNVENIEMEELKRTISEIIMECYDIEKLYVIYNLMKSYL